MQVGPHHSPADTALDSGIALRWQTGRVSDELTAWLRAEIEGDYGRARDLLDRRGAWPEPRREMHDAIADCEAKLAILNRLDTAKDRDRRSQAAFDAWKRSGLDDDQRPAFGVGSPFGDPVPQDIATLEWVARHLASGYRHRPGYKEKWKP